MQDSINQLDHSLSKLRGAITMVTGERGSRLNDLFLNVNKDFKIIQEYLAQPSSETTQSVAINVTDFTSQPPRFDAIKRFHQDAPELVLHDMGVWEIKALNRRLSDGFINREGVNILEDTFALTIRRLLITDECRRVERELMEAGRYRINSDAVRNRLVEIWKRIVAETVDHPGAGYDLPHPNQSIFTTEFMPFVERIHAAISDSNRVMIDGIEIFVLP